MLVFTVQGADFSDVGIGKSTPFTDIRDSLYAAYLLGTDYTDNPLQDLSYNGRDITLSGGACGAKSLHASSAAYGITPFSEADILGVNGAATYIAIAKASVTEAHLLVSPGTDNFPLTALVAPLANPINVTNRDSANTGSLTFGASNGLATANVSNGGSGYANVFPVTFGAVAGSGATGMAFATGGVVQRVHMTTPGSAYTSGAATIDFSAGGGTGAAGTAATGQDNARATRYEMYAGTFTATSQSLYRGWGSPANYPAQIQSGSKGTNGTFGNSRNLHFGYGNGSSTGFTASNPELVAVRLHTKVLTNTELDAVRVEMTALLAPYGVTL